MEEKKKKIKKKNIVCATIPRKKKTKCGTGFRPIDP